MISVVSVFITMVDVYSWLMLVRTVKTLEKEFEGIMNGETIWFDLIGNIIVKNRLPFKIKPNAMRKLLAKILEIDFRFIECNSIVKIDNQLLLTATFWFDFNLMF